jgi:ABC-type branched-subunit amino acid transport system substrate-binding protein
MSSRGGDARTRARRGGVRLLAGLAAATVLAGCSGTADSGGADDPGSTQVRGLDGDTITVGAITIASGPMAAAGRSVTAGNEAYFAALDGDGGVAGRYRVEIEVLDGADHPATILRRYEESHGHVAMYVQALGFRAADAILEPLMADDVLASTFALDLPWSRHQNLLAIGTPLTVGVHNALDWYVHAPGARRSVCALGDDGDYGDAAISAVRASATVLYVDLGPVITLPAAGGTVATGTVTAAVDELARERCDVVVAATLPDESATAIAHAAATGFAPEWFVLAAGQPALADPAVAAYADEHLRVIADDASWDDGRGSSGGAADLVAARDAFAPEIADDDPWFLLGYRQAMATHQVLERAVEQGDLTQTGILLAANDTVELVFAGLADDYRFGLPEYREPSRTTLLLRPDASADDAVVTVGDDLPRVGQSAFEREMQGLPPA